MRVAEIPRTSFRFRLIPRFVSLVVVARCVDIVAVDEYGWNAPVFTSPAGLPIPLEDPPGYCQLTNGILVTCRIDNLRDFG